MGQSKCQSNKNRRMFFEDEHKLQRRSFLVKGLKFAGILSLSAEALFREDEKLFAQTLIIKDKERSKIEYFDENFTDDYFLANKDWDNFVTIYEKLSKVQNYVGHGNFNLLDYDSFIAYTTSVPGISKLTKSEKDFIEKIFYFDAKKYGFNGKKVTPDLTEKIKDKDIVKIHGSGHYLLKEASYPIYEKLKKDVGETIFLTSGIRGLVKQTHLFFSKALNCKGNLSRASRSLAPPGYSYHGVGDFDIGKKGLGYLNFTDRFSKTDEFKKLLSLGYIDIRYTSNNPFGVRFEPWHIEGLEKRV